jgi:hypothetical protein
MTTGAIVSLIGIVAVAGILQVIAWYCLYGLITDRGMKRRRR